EEVAVCDETLLEQVLEGHIISLEEMRGLFAQRKTFPVCYGAALHRQGVPELMAVIDALAPEVPASANDAPLSGCVYRITRDPDGTRLTWLKLTGGRFGVRGYLPVRRPGDAAVQEMDKVDQIRRYSGERYETLQEACAGQIVAVTGIDHSRAGDLIGETAEGGQVLPVLLTQPILRRRILAPEEVDPSVLLRALRILEEEEPALSVEVSEEHGAQRGLIYARVCGPVQTEILQHLIRERFGWEVDFGPEQILYREMVAEPVEGVGHFEPLRHYAEVHLLLEPGEPGSGLTFATEVSADQLAVHWQRLILTNLAERRHRGVLTGSELTDTRITVIGGRAHEKHTEGGDFREATWRAVRQGLMSARSILLEPVVELRAEIPSAQVGRVLSDIQRRCGQADIQMNDGSRAVVTGRVPASELGDYAQELSGTTHGEGRLSVSLRGYEPCHNAEEVIRSMAYDPDTDLAQPASSVFCSHGAGFIVPWDQVRSYMHVDTGWQPETPDERPEDAEAFLQKYGEGLRAVDRSQPEDTRDFKERSRDFFRGERELEEIFARTYGPVHNRAREEETRAKRVVHAPGTTPHYRKPVPFDPAKDKSYLLVDGYNVIHADETLRQLAERDIKSARDRLMDILLNFQGYRGEIVILVFDAYRVAGGTERVFRYGDRLDVVFTREAETADQYIERTAHSLSRNSRVTVATSDAVEQVIIFAGGALRMSAQEFWAEIAHTEAQIRAEVERINIAVRNESRK
ncbi:MAG: NYN domain-containing protein, partial [Butyrivibrio sp.]|nr:NYN domain-containing protein [Butyrivibrio sp.]